MNKEYTEWDIKYLAAKYLLLSHSNEIYEEFIKSYNIDDTVDLVFNADEINEIKKQSKILTKLSKI